MAINPNTVDIKNIIELMQSSPINDNDLLVIGQGIYARKSAVIELYNKFGVPSILTSLNNLQLQINQINNTNGFPVTYYPQLPTPLQQYNARNNIDVYDKSEVISQINSKILLIGNVVNSVTGVNVDNTDPKNPIVAEFRPIVDYNNDMLLKADIDGNLTTGGIWWQDQVLTDRFANYKQVWTAFTNQTIEWGNLEVAKQTFLVNNANSLEIKTTIATGTIWNSLNLTNVSQLNNDAGYLQANDLDGFVYDVNYNSSTHTITFFQQNEPNLVIDLPIESLIKDISLVNIGGVDYLRLTFEDGTFKDVPLNTLLVGVVKKVNGLVPNSLGEIILQITDIPNLSSELNNKANINATNINVTAYQNALGITTPTLQSVTNNGNSTTLEASFNGVTIGFSVSTFKGFDLDQDFSFLLNRSEANRILTGGVLASNSYADASLIPTYGIYSKGNVIVPNATSNNHAVNLGQLNTAISTIPTPNNPTITLQANGDIAGGGTFTLNQLGAQTIPFDLTAQTKLDIQAGQNAGQLVNGITDWFQRLDMSGGGSVATRGFMVTVVHTAGISTLGITIDDHNFNGAKVVLKGYPNAQVNYNINWQADDGTINTSLNTEETFEFYWDSSAGYYTLGNS